MNNVKCILDVLEPIDTYKVKKSLSAVTSLNGASKFNIAGTMVTFLSLIIAANVTVVGLKSRPIWISPGFDLKTSSMVNSADMDSLVGLSHLL